MVLRDIEYHGFRNLIDNNITFEDNFNFITGDNASGKTNLLEAIFYGAFASSFRTGEEQNLIRFNENHLRVAVRSDEKTGMVFYNGEKKMTLDGIAKTRLSDYVGWLVVTVLSLEDIWIIRSAPAKRRSFLDWLIAKFRPGYLFNLGEYRKVLKQRNKTLQLIRDGRNGELLEVYDEQLIRFGNEIYRERCRLMPELDRYLGRFGDALGLERLSLSYQSTCPERAITPDILARNRSHEIRWGETIAGPHRDDILFLIDRRPLKEFASEGEERSAVIALKLAEAEMLYDSTKSPPVLLLDEIAAELDRPKREILFSLARDLNASRNGQIFYASAQAAEFTGDRRYRKFLVKRGAVEVS